MTFSPKLIGEGDEGCVINQAMANLCTFLPIVEKGTVKQYSKQMITKIVKNEQTYKEEIQKAEILSRLDPKMQYTIYPIRHCIMHNSGTQPVNKAISKCSEPIRNSSKLYLLEMPYGGTDLNMMVERNEKLTHEEIEQVQYQLNRALGMLHHGDLTAKNVVIDRTHNNRIQVRLIDFNVKALAQKYNKESEWKLKDSADYMSLVLSQIAKLVDQSDTVGINMYNKMMEHVNKFKTSLFQEVITRSVKKSNKTIHRETVMNDPGLGTARKALKFGDDD